MTKQAKVLDEKELRRVLDYISTRKHAARNRVLVLLSHGAGLRVCELSALRIADIANPAGQVFDTVYLRPDQTKGSDSRTVYLNTRMQKELATYLRTLKTKQPNSKLFYSQKSDSDGFNANTLCQFFGRLYKSAGINGATSHSGRRKFCTSLSESGISTKVIMTLSGHKHLSSLERYIAVTPQTIRKAIELA
jgi:integrase/recombinase XerD